jgi:UDP:flavonoid glycosyltransferase YjiC (YdhE family)
VKKRILFVAENVTLAQTVRLARLAEALPPSNFEVHFASSSFPDLVFAETSFTKHEVTTLPAERAAKALDAGKRLYEKRTLLEYVDAELRLLDNVEPDLVVGDFRLSLSTSAELRGVPSGVLINAYWSPYAVRDKLPVPDHPIVKMVGEELAEKYFPIAVPKVFQHFAKPINAARKSHGLAPVGSLMEVLCHADYTLYPDDPQLTPIANAPASHRFIGPVLWEPRIPPPNLDFYDPERPLIYVTLGSSGKLDLLPRVIEALTPLPVNVVLATAARARLDSLPSHIRAYEYVPGSDISRRARVVVSNGGSTTGYQALREGTPVVGIPNNFDQYLATDAIVQAGAGVCVKARLATAENIRESVLTALNDSSLAQAAAGIARRFSTTDSNQAFRAWVEEAIETHTFEHARVANG